MPGIFGLVLKQGAGRRTAARQVAAMQDELLANPLFEANAWTGGRFGLGRVGLPLPGVERFAAADGGCAALEGFVYGWRDLPPDLCGPTGSPAARLLAVQRRAPERLAAAIDGSYQAAVADPAADTLLVWNDRFGYRHLYWYEDEEALLFAAEIKALLTWPALRRTLDLDAVADFFNYGYPLGEGTFVAGVRALPAGHLLGWQDGRVILKRWAPPLRFAPDSASLQERIEELDALYPKILARRLQPEGEIALPLSGGLDSRFILGHAARLGLRPRVFTHGKKGCLDLDLARRATRAAGVPGHTFIPVQARWMQEQGERFVRLQEGMCHLQPATLLAVGEQYGLDPVRTCFLNGIFGGPCNYAASYYNESDLRDDLDERARMRSMRRTLFGLNRDRGYYAIFAPEFADLAERRYEEAIQAELARHAGVSERFCDVKDAFFIDNRLRRHTCQIDCNRHLWHDHFAIADEALLEFYLRMPAELKVGRRFLMAYFLQVFPELARVPYQATGVPLDRRPSERRLRARERLLRWGRRLERASLGRVQVYDMRNYYHWDQWYRTEPGLRRWFEDVLLDRRTRERGLYRSERVEAALRRQARGGTSFVFLSSLVSCELFCRLFLDGTPPTALSPRAEASALALQD